jgi:hypothetical protein
MDIGAPRGMKNGRLGAAAVQSEIDLVRGCQEIAQ